MGLAEHSRLGCSLGVPWKEGSGEQIVVILCMVEKTNLLGVAKLGKILYTLASGHVHGSQAVKLNSPAPFLKTRLLILGINNCSIGGLITGQFILSMLFLKGLSI